MSRLTWRVTIIDPDASAEDERELQAWLEARYPEGVVEVRRTIESGARRAEHS
jgi:hypothetical protein